MKKYVVFIALFIVSVVLVHSQSGIPSFDEKPAGAVITFEKEVHDYGTVPLTEIGDGKIEFEFTNTGKQPLLITNVTACCGTQVKDYPKAPVAPGESGTIKVEFRISPRPHAINRRVNVFSNADNTENKQLRIIGNIVEASATSDKNQLN